MKAPFYFSPEHRAVCDARGNVLATVAGRAGSTFELLSAKLIVDALNAAGVDCDTTAKLEPVAAAPLVDTLRQALLLAHHELKFSPINHADVEARNAAMGEIREALRAAGVDFDTPAKLEPVAAAPVCQRCDSTLHVDGKCSDTTCPFSDCLQSDSAGLAGHPTAPVDDYTDDDMVGEWVEAQFKNDFHSMPDVVQAVYRDAFIAARATVEAPPAVPATLSDVDRAAIERLSVKPQNVVAAGSVENALRLIVVARDHNAEHGYYPAAPNGPDEDQEFDDWAADVAGAVLTAASIRKNLAPIKPQGVVAAGRADRVLIVGDVLRGIQVYGPYTFDQAKAEQAVWAEFKSGTATHILQFAED